MNIDNCWFPCNKCSTDTFFLAMLYNEIRKKQETERQVDHVYCKKRV